jgi:GNAT superfamily N-acetyltransferase
LTEALRLCHGEGWDLTIDDLADFMACRGHALAASSENNLLGIIMAMVYPPLAWIGNLVVERSCRGRGIGSALLSSLLQQLEASGVVHTVVLEARPGTSGFYARFGFETVATTLRYRMELAPGPETPSPGTDVSTHPSSEQCVPIAESALDHVFRLDREAFGADRRGVLRNIHARAVFSLGAWRDGNLLAYLMVRQSANGYRIGPWVGSTSDDTQLLYGALNLLRSSVDPARPWVVAAVPEPALAARTAFLRAGFLQVAEGVRMILRLSPLVPSADTPPRTRLPPSVGPQVWALAGLDRG